MERVMFLWSVQEQKNISFKFLFKKWRRQRRNNYEDKQDWEQKLEKK